MTNHSHGLPIPPCGHGWPFRTLAVQNEAWRLRTNANKVDDAVVVRYASRMDSMALQPPFRLSPIVRRPAPANHLGRLTQWSHRLDPLKPATECTLFFARKEIDSDPILIHVKSYFNRVSTLRIDKIQITPTPFINTFFQVALTRRNHRFRVLNNHDVVRECKS